MSLYLMDLEYGTQTGRRWKEMLPTFIVLGFNRLVQPSRIVHQDDGKPPTLAPNERHLVLIHRSSIESDGKRIGLARGMAIPVLVVSNNANQSEMAGLAATDTCYYRQGSVLTRSQGEDLGFKQLFQTFWDEYRTTGRLQWSLLEQEATPEGMLAVFLVARAMTRFRGEADAEKRKRIVAAIPAALLVRAKAEFESKGGQGWDGRLPDSLAEVEAVERALGTFFAG